MGFDISPDLQFFVILICIVAISLLVCYLLGMKNYVVVYFMVALLLILLYAFDVLDESYGFIGYIMIAIGLYFILKKKGGNE